MYWFFQTRSAFMRQRRMKKWSRDNLDDYVLLPAAPGFITRKKCFFVSHFWHTKDDPDPDGECLLLHQRNFASQTWSYIWLDWTCIPNIRERYLRQCTSSGASGPCQPSSANVASLTSILLSSRACGYCMSKPSTHLRALEVLQAHLTMKHSSSISRRCLLKVCRSR